jgi:ABC-type antimicrobial peptide transport system permease subunit
VISGLLTDGIDQAVIYLPSHLSGEQEQALLVRTRRTASAALSAIDSAVASEAGATARRLAPMRDVLRFQSWPLLLFGSAMSALAAFGILLALTGCYGMLSYTVARRTREFGVRAAIGATPAALGWFVARQSASIASIAIPAGMVFALGLSRVITSTLDMAPAFNVSAFMIGAVAGLATTAAASYLPSRRATRVDPAVALRAE